MQPFRFFGRRQGRALTNSQRLHLTQHLAGYEIVLAEPPRPLVIPHLFARPYSSYVLEIGFGGGEHLAALAQSSPDVGFIGVEAFSNGVANLLTHMQRHQIENIRIFPDDVRTLLPYLPKGIFEMIAVLFADPWPKKGHQKRRLVQKPFLAELHHLLAPGGELRIATDHSDYLAFILEQIDETLYRPRFELDALPTQRPDDWPATRYEQKALLAGRVCTYLTFEKRAPE